MCFSFSAAAAGGGLCPLGREEHGTTESLPQGLICTGQYCESSSTCWEGMASMKLSLTVWCDHFLSTGWHRREIILHEVFLLCASI